MILHHEFVAIVKKFGKKLAIVDRLLNRRLTYSKALIASLILAKKFRRFDESIIGVMAPTSAGGYLAVLGLLMAGKVPAMINYSTGAEDNAKYAQKKCKFSTIITFRALLEKIKCPLIPGMICLEDVMEEITIINKLGAALRTKLSTASIINSFPKANIDDNVVILFTSGSEKEPKAVQLTHRNIGSNIKDAVEVFELTSEDKMMAMLPLFHVFGHMSQFWLPFLTGMTTVTYAVAYDYKTIPVIMREEKTTMTASTPIFFANYLKESTPGDFQTMRIMVAGADKCPDWLREGYKEKHGIELLEGYGTTETSPVISANTPKVNRPGSIGKVLPNVKVKIVDIDTAETLPAGQEGKILVKGDLVMKGYYEDEEQTAEKIKDGWYDTGDIGMLDEDGFLWHRGRFKRFVKIGGEMVSMVRVESVLEEMLPAGVSCCVVDVPDKVKGAKLVAAVTEEIDDIVDLLADKLPPIAIPKQTVVFPELPKMATGKLDFRTITQMVRETLSEKS